MSTDADAGLARRQASLVRGFQPLLCVIEQSPIGECEDYRWMGGEVDPINKETGQIYARKCWSSHGLRDTREWLIVLS